MSHGLYQVVGSRRYRGHNPGDIFEARLDRMAEHRAVRRGEIVLLDRTVPAIQPGSFVFPDGWLPDPPGSSPDTHHDEAPRGASIIERR